MWLQIVNLQLLRITPKLLPSQKNSIVDGASEK